MVVLFLMFWGNSTPFSRMAVPSCQALLWPKTKGRKRTVEGIGYVCSLDHGDGVTYVQTQQIVYIKYAPFFGYQLYINFLNNKNKNNKGGLQKVPGKRAASEASVPLWVLSINLQLIHPPFPRGAGAGAGANVCHACINKLWTILAALWFAAAFCSLENVFQWEAPAVLSITCETE